MEAMTEKRLKHEIGNYPSYIFTKYFNAVVITVFLVNIIFFLKRNGYEKNESWGTY